MPDLARRDVGALAAEPQLDPVDHLVDAGVRDGAAGEGLADARLDLLAVEGLALSVALHDHEPHVLDPLVGREPAAARAALAPAADGAARVRGARIDHPVVVGVAPGAAHRGDHEIVAAGTRGGEGTRPALRGRDERAPARGRGRRPRARWRRRSRRRPRAGPGRGRRAVRDRPQRVAGPDDVRDRGRTPRGVHRPGRPPARRSEDRHEQGQGHEPSANVRSAHAVSLPERAFDVNARIRTYVCVLSPWAATVRTTM